MFFLQVFFFGLSYHNYFLDPEAENFKRLKQMNVQKTLQAEGLETNPGWAAFSITFYIFVSINIISCTTSPPILKK